MDNWNRSGKFYSKKEHNYKWKPTHQQPHGSLDQEIDGWPPELATTTIRWRLMGQIETCEKVSISLAQYKSKRDIDRSKGNEP